MRVGVVGIGRYLLSDLAIGPRPRARRTRRRATVCQTSARRLGVTVETGVAVDGGGRDDPAAPALDRVEFASGDRRPEPIAATGRAPRRGSPGCTPAEPLLRYHGGASRSSAALAGRVARGRPARARRPARRRGRRRRSPGGLVPFVPLLLLERVIGLRSLWSWRRSLTSPASVTRAASPGWSTLGAPGAGRALLLRVAGVAIFPVLGARFLAALDAGVSEAPAVGVRPADEFPRPGPAGRSRGSPRSVALPRCHGSPRVLRARLDSRVVARRAHTRVARQPKAAWQRLTVPLEERHRDPVARLARFAPHLGARHKKLGGLGFGRSSRTSPDGDPCSAWEAVVVRLLAADCYQGDCASGGRDGERGVAGQSADAVPMQDAERGWRGGAGAPRPAQQ